MLIRAAQPADAAQLAGVHVRSWQQAYRGLLPADYLDGLDPADSTARWRADLGDSAWPRRGVLVGVDGDTVLGFASVCRSRDADADPAAVGELRAIYDPPWWRHGLGRQLLSSAVDALAAGSFRQATLWVLAGNTRAIGFYERSGWLADAASRTIEVGDQPVHELRYRREL